MLERVEDADQEVEERYVLGNSRKHELERTGRSQIPALSDPHSSAPWFEELLDPYEDFPPGEPPIAREDLDAPCRLAQVRPYDAPPLTRTVPPAGLESPKPR